MWGMNNNKWLESQELNKTEAPVMNKLGKLPQTWQLTLSRSAILEDNQREALGSGQLLFAVFIYLLTELDDPTTVKSNTR